MGLDQFAYVVDEEGEREEIAYWRKHNRLHGWMEKLAIKKGIVDNPLEFNCVDLPLSKEDLQVLQGVIIGKELPETKGFFFSSDSYDQYDVYRRDTDLKFLAQAIAAVESGAEVVYDSWW